MSKEELKNEKLYQTTMYMVRKLFEDWYHYGGRVSSD